MPALLTRISTRPKRSSVRGKQRVYLIGVGHIALHRQGLAAGLLDHADHFGGGIGAAAVVDDDFRALLCQRDRNGPSDPAPRPRYNGDLILKSSHVYP